MRPEDKCAHCHHRRDEHFLEGGACWHMTGEKLGVRCSCQRFKQKVKV